MNSYVTLVSCYITNINSRKDRSTEKYIEYGKILLQTKIPKIIFIDEIIFDDLKKYSNELTHLIPIKKNSIYLYNFKDLLTNFKINSTSPEKDTIEYMFTICSKTEWITKAIELNFFNTSNFIWVDFGIKHVFNCNDDEFIKKIERLNYSVYKNIRIGSIWNPDIKYSGDIYKDVMWYFAGGIFGGNKESLLLFSKKTKEMCIKIIVEKNTIMWEVNIWHLVYNDLKELFNCYNCDHNSSIIDNY